MALRMKRNDWKKLIWLGSAASLKAVFILGLAACGSDPEVPAASPTASTRSATRPAGRPGRTRTPAPVPVTSDDCAQVHSHDETKTVSFKAEALTDAEIQHYRDNQATEMPYISTMTDRRGSDYRHAMAIRNLSDAPSMSGITPYVANKQTMLKFVVKNLPARNTVGSVHGAGMSLYVHKVSREAYTRTELLCFAEQHACSGEVFTAPNYLRNINRDYFRDSTGPANGFFASQLLEKKLDARVGTNDIYSGRLDMTLENLLEGTGIEPLDLIYGDADPAQPLAERSIIVIVADDTYVVPDAEFGPQEAYLSVSLQSSGWEAVTPAAVDPTQSDAR